MNFIRCSLLAAIATAALLLGGCASPAQSNAMVPTSLGAVTKHAESLALNVTGGSETTATTASQISSADFASALDQSIRRSGLFAKIATAGQAGDYHLEVAIVRLQQPLFGFSMTATIETNWTLTRVSDHSVVWRKAITTSHTAGAGEAFVGATRLRLATEGAARDNIQDAVAQMGALTLP
ncbi:MAG: hypothetical protein HY302_07540 [Opitutae bacterium]|nr:hypothetical protein [Opitutae bacterium]